MKKSRLGKRILASAMVLMMTLSMLGEYVAPVKAAGETAGLLSGTSIDLKNVSLTAVYMGEDGVVHTDILSLDSETTFPYNADIKMRLDFSIGNGNAVDISKTYVYKLPDTVRVDVEATHQLSDINGDSIGEVHIARDGTLTFTFNDSIKNNSNIPFYVEFQGGLSESLQSADKSANITFPTASGGFTYKVKTQDSTNKTIPNEPGDIAIEKSGVRKINLNGKNYLEWTVALGPNGRDKISGEIVDVLPANLQYAQGTQPWLEGANGGSVSLITGNDKEVRIKVENVSTYWRANVKFYTEYDGVFAAPINPNAEKIVNNAVSFKPNGEDPVTANGKINLRPSVVEKEGQLTDDNEHIKWKVTVNAENLDLAGATYTDTIAAGHELDGDVKITCTDSPSVTVTPPTTSPTGFTVKFPAGTHTYEIEYITKITDFSAVNYENSGTLADTKLTPSATVKKTVTGPSLLNKTLEGFNSVTNTFTWKIEVNKDKKPLTNVDVTDFFNTRGSSIGKMEYSSSTVTVGGVEKNPESVGFVNSTEGDNTKLSYHFATLSDTAVITVVTKIVDPNNYTNGWHEFKNTANMKSDQNALVTKEANTWRQTTVPDLISKDGVLNGDGTIDWKVTVFAPQSPLETESFEFSDVLPADMKYVNGSFYLQDQYWDDKPLYRDPELGTSAGGKQTISYKLNPANPELDNKEESYMKKAFEIHYKTMTTDINKANTETSYTNEATAKVKYKGYPVIEETEPKTLTGIVGGTLNKTFDYQNGKDYVDWTVNINEARLNLGGVDKSYITDQLADYFDYVSGKLYQIDTDGTKREVPTEKYYVTVVNNKLTVQMNFDLGTNAYSFEFRTRFNCMAIQLKDKDIKNTVSFESGGTVYSKESASVQSVNFSSSSAGSRIRREIRVKKVDADTKTTALAGAVFQLSVGDIVVGEATTGADGYAVFEDLSMLTQYELKLVEIQAPDGYKWDGVSNTTSGYETTNATTTVTGYKDDKLSQEKLPDGTTVSYYEVIIPNNKITTASVKGKIQIQKQNESGTKNLKGAVFGLYKTSDDAENSTNRILSKTTDENGQITIDELEVGTYYLKELTSPEGYKVDTTPIKAEVAATGTAYGTPGTATTGFYTIKNTSAKGTLKIKKQDTSGHLITSAQATFSLYTDANCQNRIATEKTTAGIAAFTDLELGKTYYYRETSAPTGYILDTTIRSAVVGTAASRVDVEKEVTVTNQKAVGDIEITKQDNSVPAVKLSGVEFSLYSNEACTTPVYKPNVTPTVHYVVKTNAYGVATFSNLPFGTYYVKETKAPDGYYADVATPVKVVVDKLGKTNVTVVNDRIRCDIKIKKTDGTDPLPGAAFTLYTSAGAVVRNAVTGTDGTAVFTDIVYGEYYIKETQAPAGYTPDSNRVDISKEQFGTGYAVAGHVIDLTATPIVNTKQNGSVSFTKMGHKEGVADAPLGGAVFTLYDEDMLPIATAESEEGTGKVSFTDLAYGTYYIRETKIPVGYKKRVETTYKVEITDNTAKTTILDENDMEVSQVINDEIIPPFFSFKVKKTDDGTPAKTLANAVFTLYQDNNPIATSVSDTEGIAYFRRIRIVGTDRDATYTIKETSAPAGYKKSENTVTVSTTDNELLRYADGDEDGNNPLTDDQILFVGLLNETSLSPTDASNATFVNEEIKGRIVITKEDDHNNLLKGAEFGIYKDFAATNPVMVGTKALTAVTGDNGVAVFSDLSFGTYYIKEKKAPVGYTLNPEVKTVRLVGALGSTASPAESVQFTDTALSLTVSKLAVGGNREVSGAKFALKKAGSTTALYTWTSSSAPTAIPNTVLEAGQTYVITETEAPAGYGYMGDVTFKINEDGSLTVISGSVEKNNKTLVLRDQPINLTIQKVDSADTTHLLPGAVLAVYDGSMEVARFTTTDSGYTLPLGTLKAPAAAGGEKVYTLKEISAPDGYETAASITIRVDHNGTITTDPTGALVGNTLTMKDVEKSDTALYVRKWDADTHLDISGAEFEVFKGYADIDDSSKAVERWTSNGDAHKLGTDLLNGFTGYEAGSTIYYYLVETKAPTGYIKMEEKIKFHIDKSSGKSKIVIDEGGPLGDTELVNGDGDTFLIKNKPLDVKIRKQNAYGTVLKGAKLELWTYDKIAKEKDVEKAAFESDGVGAYQVDSSVLMTDTDYILIETNAPDGYFIADPITFSIDENGTLTRDDGVKVFNNTIVMEDKEAALSIGKRDLDTKIGLAGSKLHLTSLDDPHFAEETWVSDGTTKTWDIVDLTPGCTYELTELEAPDGYAYADPIRFKVDADTHDILVEGTPQENRTVYIEDGMLTLDVSKQNLITAEDIAGAEFIVLDETNTTVATWTSDGTLFTVDTSQMKAGVGKGYKEYTLRETKAPEGYHLADDLIFAFDTYGNLYHVSVNALGIKQYNLMADNKITIYDDPMLCITKVTEAGTVIEGASLQITSKDDDGFTPIKWTSKKKPLYIDQNLLVPGKTYVLSELSAPKGYGIAKDIEFSVNAAGKLILNGTVTDDPSIRMTDAEIKVVIAKKDKETKELLADAKLAIKNGKGEIVYSFTTTTKAVTLPAELFTAPEGNKLRTYTLSELAAPKNYEVAADIEFAIDKEGQVYLKNSNGKYKKADGNIIEMFDVKSGTENVKTATVTSANKQNVVKKMPKTGDESPLAMWISLLMIGLLGMVCGIAVLFKTSKNDKKGRSL